MITSIYDLMGEYVSPPVDETTRDKHVASVLKVNLILKILI